MGNLHRPSGWGEGEFSGFDKKQGIPGLTAESMELSPVVIPSEFGPKKYDEALGLPRHISFCVRLLQRAIPSPDPDFVSKTPEVVGRYSRFCESGRLGRPL